MQLCPTAHPTVRSSIPLHCFLLRPCRPSSLHRKQVDSMVVTTRVSSLATTSQPTQAPLRPGQASQGHAPRCICKPVQASQHPSTAATTEDANLGGRTDRRALLLGGSALVLSPAVAPPANAIQGLTAGRIPGTVSSTVSRQWGISAPRALQGAHRPIKSDDWLEALARNLVPSAATSQVSPPKPMPQVSTHTSGQRARAEVTELAGQRFQGRACVRWPHTQPACSLSSARQQHSRE